MGPLVFCVTFILLQAVPVSSVNNVPEITDYTSLDNRRMKEDFKVGGLVGQIKAFDPDDPSDPVTYEILGPGSEYFAIGLDTGIVTLKKRLDFDVGTESEIRMRIRVVDRHQQVQIVEGKVFVEDVNDNPPEFDRQDLFKTVPEDTPVGDVIADISVGDRDNTNDILTVRCKPASELFADACDKFGLHFSPSDTSNKGWKGQLRLNKEVDFETRNSYAILLEANDGLFNETNEIHIEIEDINDSPPTWQRIRPVFINEENRIGTVISTVTANDGDNMDPPRKIFYEMIDGKGYFGINNDTGDIFNSARIDFDAAGHLRGFTYDIKIKAREVISSSPLELGNDEITTSTAAVTITISDIDDNAPLFDQDNYLAYIPESIVTGSNIPGLLMTVTDIDSQTYNSFDLKIFNHTDVFDLIPKTGQANAGAALFVKDGDKIDYEKGPREYIILIKSFEQNPIPDHSGSATVTIRITDVNDQDPVFSHDIYYKSIPETSPPGTSVIDLNAEDNEAGNFGTNGIRYKLFGSLKDHFVIDEVTGLISVGQCPTPGVFPCIDAERKSQSFLTVSATDNLGRGRSRSVQVIVNITDQNDNIPDPEKDYRAFIMEGETDPVQPILIKAIDPDVAGGPLMYELIGPASVNWKIETKLDSFGDRVGEITARRPILFSDAENPMTGELNFKVLSKDQKSTVESNVKIIIIDINNNKPVFSKDVYETDLLESTTGEVFVFTVTASDADAPTTGNGIIDFSIDSGALGKFTVKSKRVEGGNVLAEIYTTPDARFNYDLNKRYEIILEARDQGTPSSKKGTATLIVNILDVNNNIPVITPSSFSIAVPEDRPLNTNVHTIFAVDKDETADLKFYMQATRAQNPTGSSVDKTVYDYENLFRVEKDTGIVRVNAALNREQTSFVVYQILAVDEGASPQQTGTGTLLVTITEVNDQDPEFDLPLYNIDLNEELNIQYFVRNLHCTDEDDKIASYSIVQTEPRSPNFFSVVDVSGVMTISNRIDFETIEKIRLTAYCVDNGNPRRSGTTSIVINVQNINDNPPIFDQSPYNGQIDETRLGQDIGGTVITTVNARDLDKGDYGIVRYGMADLTNPFEIDEITGRITVKSNTVFDRESESSYIFQVVAYDSPNTPSVRKSTTVPVYLTIRDINDNCPTITEDFYRESVPESAQTNTDIIDIIAKDIDFGINKQLVYSVQDGTFDPPVGQNYFDIGRKSGRIYTLLTLSRKSGTYKFNITVTDTEGTLPAIMCSSNVPIEVTVLPSENNAPRWIRPPQRDFVIYVLESQYEGMLVYNSRAVDLDSGPGGIIDYFFMEGNAAVSATKEFRINQVTGIIRAEVEFDREQVDTYFLTLLARDQGATRATSQTTLTVVILDVDDNDPAFETKDGQVTPLVLPEFELQEEEWAGTDRLLGQCQASDEDSDHKNNQIFYEILSANDEVRQMIRVDRDNCNIYLTKAVDYEKFPQLEFSIYAFNERSDDSVIREKRKVNLSILPVVVRVTDTNDNPPAFTKDEYFACASLESPYRSAIVDLDAEDVEQSETELKYSLEGTNSFSIDETVGIVRNSISFSSNPTRVFAFQAAVTDGTFTKKVPVNVFITAESNQVRIKVNRPSSDVRRVMKEYQSLVTSTSPNIHYACVDIRNHITDRGVISSTESDVYVTALKLDPVSGYMTWPASDLYSQLSRHRSDNSEQYSSAFIGGIERADEDGLSLDEDVVLTILIITIILIVLAIILLCLACYCIWHKKKKKTKKVKARRHVIVQDTADTQQESFHNPVYSNKGYVAYEDEYSTVAKAKSGPMNPVIVPAPMASFQPEEVEAPSPAEDFEPEVETEFVPNDEPEPVIETVIEPGTPEEPVDEDDIETEIVDHEDDLPLPDPPAEEEIVTEIRDDPPPPPDY